MTLEGRVTANVEVVGIDYELYGTSLQYIIVLRETCRYISAPQKLLPAPLGRIKAL
jgi:hypothetical protein